MQIHRSRPILLTASVLVALIVSAAPAIAQAQPWISYAAKFVCGLRVSPPPVRLVDGRYKTIVNLHNPHYLRDPPGLPLPVVFFKKVVLALPQGQPPLPPSCKLQEILRADEALQVDCNAIKAQLAISGLPSAGAIEGFVVVEVPPQPLVDDPAPPLDVVAVYTSKPGAGEVSTMDVERIPPTAVIGIPDDDPCQ